MLVYIYSRKSKFTGKGESIENQIQLCTDYVRQHIPNGENAEIITFEDEGFSGKNLDRPHFQKMMSSTYQKKVDYIVCYRLDRISRSVNDFSALIEDLARRKISFICIKEQFDTSTPMGKAMMYIASVFAQLERETIAERIRDNMYMLSRTGRWLGGTTPLGFQSKKEDFVSIDNKVRTACKLVSEKDEMDKYHLVCEKFLELKSLSGTVRYLAQHDIHTRKGNAFSVQTLKDILSNPVYCAADQRALAYFLEKKSDICFADEEWDGKSGILAYNRTNHDIPNQGRTEISEWIIAIGKHKPAISSEKWIEIQRILEAQSNKGQYAKRKTLTSPALLSGLIHCAKCGSCMRPHLHSRRRFDDTTPVFYYICERKERSSGHQCDMKNASGNVIDKMVCQALCDFDKIDSHIYAGLSELRKKSANQKNLEMDRRAVLSGEYDKKQAMINNLIFVLAQGETDDYAITLIKSQINELHSQCQGLQKEIDDLSITMEDFEDFTSQVEAVTLMLSRFRDTFDMMSVMDKKDLLRSVIDHIDWDGEKCHIFLLGE